eukprot:scaffold71515_cov63-Phaeocystis_antarctica.AAC.2
MLLAIAAAPHRPWPSLLSTSGAAAAKIMVRGGGGAAAAEGGGHACAAKGGRAGMLAAVGGVGRAVEAAAAGVHARSEATGCRGFAPTARPRNGRRPQPLYRCETGPPSVRLPPRPRTCPRSTHGLQASRWPAPTAGHQGDRPRQQQYIWKRASTGSDLHASSAVYPGSHAVQPPWWLYGSISPCPL